MKKIKAVLCFVIITLLVCSLSGCSEKYEDMRECLEKNLSEITVNNYTSNVAEDDEYVYLAASDGIYMIGKQSLSKTRLCRAENPQNLFAYEGRVFFTDRDYANLYCTDKGGKTETVIAASAYSYEKDVVCIDDYFIYGGKIYVFGAAKAFSYDTASGEIENIVGNEGAEMLGIYENKPIFIEHASRTFTLYSLEHSGEKKVLLGQGTTEPDKDLIVDFRVNGSSVYFIKRAPFGLFVLEEQAERELFAGDVKHIQVKDDTLYFSVEGELYCFNGQAVKVPLAKRLSEGGRFLILDGLCLYEDSNGTARAEKIR